METIGGDFTLILNKCFNREFTSQSNGLWSEYPNSDPSTFLSGDQIEMLLQKSHRLKDLSPPMKEFRLKEKSDFYLRGHMTLRQRELHRNDPNTVWWTTSEMDYMLAFLLRDTRYDKYVSILPVQYCLDIEQALIAYEKLQQMLARHGGFKKELVLNDEDKKILDKYNEMTEHICQRVLEKDKDMFSKRMIIFPENSSNSHWKATFIFNPSNITGGKGQRDYSHPCFFRYDPYYPDGSGRTKNARGLLWFLNVLYSFGIRSKQQITPGCTIMPWFDPFGVITTQGFLKGTDGFMAIRLSPDQAKQLPHQKDTWNCGTAVIATAAIIMQDFFIESHDGFFSQFECGIYKGQSQ